MAVNLGSENADAEATKIMVMDERIEKNKPSCANCGNPIYPEPRLKVILGFHKRSYGKDKISRHVKYMIPFMSAYEV